MEGYMNTLLILTKFPRFVDLPLICMTYLKGGTLTPIYKLQEGEE